MLCYLVDPIFQVINTAGKPATGGYIEVYVHGTGDKYYCASDFDGTLHPFKIPLDSLGSNIILADDANAYDIYAYNRYGSLLMSRYNVAVSKSEGGNSSRKGTIHKIGMWTVDESDPSPKPSEYWVLDLESPNDSAPGGYDRLTVERARDIHNSGSFFGLRTIHVQNPYDDNLLLETNFEFIAMSQTFELKLAYIHSSNHVSEYTLGNFGEYVGVSLVNDVSLVQEGDAILNHNKLHRLRPVADEVIGETSENGGWVLDLESPNENAPGGYDRLTPQRLNAILDNGEFLVIEVYDSGSYEVPLALQALVQVTNQNPFRISVDFVRQYVNGNILGFQRMKIYTPSGAESYLQMLDVGPQWRQDKEALAVNGDGSDVTATFTEAQTRANIGTGEKLSVLFGKIAKWLGDLKALAFKDKADLTQDVIGVLPIANGGTNADTTSGARTNLDVYSKSEVDNALPQATSTTPSMDGTASVGSETRWAKGDHVHPTDTSREATANKTTTVRQNGQADNTKFPTEAAVRTAIDSAVSSAYHAAGTKTVAQLTSSLLVSANEGDVYNITDSGTTTSDFIEGAGHPISVGDNVVVCDVGGGVYKFDLLSGFVDLTNYLTKTGDGSDVTASFTAASTRTNVTTGEKLSVLFGKIAKWFSDLKALAFKDKVNTSDIDDDAVTADKVKDGETLPANVTGSAKSLSSSLCAYGSSGSKFRLVAKSAPLGNTVNVHFEYRISASNYNLFQSATLQFNAVYSESTSSIVFSGAKVINDHGSSGLWKFYLVPNVAEQKVEIYAESTGTTYNSLNLIALFANGESQNYINGTTYFNTVVNSIPTPNVVVPVRTAVSTETGVGNATTPVYIDNKGVPQPCATSTTSVDTVVATFTHTLTSSEVSNGYFEFTIDSSTAFTTTSTFVEIKNATLYNELILLQTNTALNHDAVCFDISHFDYDVDSASSASYVRWPLIMGKNVSNSYAKGLLAVPIENLYKGTLDSIRILVSLPQGMFTSNDTIHVTYNATTTR